MADTGNLRRLSTAARRAVEAQDWPTVSACARKIIKQDVASAEGHFLSGLVEKASGRPVRAAAAFAKALDLDADRYDAAVELANQYSVARRNADVASLLERYEGRLGNSPRYLDMAGTVYVSIGMAERAWPLYRKANELQSGVDLFQANMASCAVYLGRIEEARKIYRALLARFPTHQRNHYHLSRLGRAQDDEHVEQMKAVLRATNLPADRNIFLYYAIGKELEDLERWEEAFEYYKLGGDAARSVASYDVAVDVELIDRIIEVCDARWLASGPSGVATRASGKTPIFIVGLPRTGTTLTERILSSHSRVESLGETQFMQMVLRRESGVETVEGMTPAIVDAVAKKDIALIAEGYLQAVSYRLGGRAMFIDKLPLNVLYAGFIAKAFPDAGIVLLRRNPMDACFAMYKQPFFRFAFTLEDVGRYYVAYDRLLKHWRQTLGERLIEVSYEALVAEQEAQTRMLLDRLGLEFEPACLDFEQNAAAIATASSVQVRERMHTRSVNRWKNFERELQPLQDILRRAGVEM